MMSQIASLSGQSGGAIFEVYTRETPAKPGASEPRYEQITQLELVIVAADSDGQSAEHPHFVDFITPDRREIRSKEFETVNLDYLARGEQMAVDRGWELYLLNKVMSVLAHIDPRIKGSDRQPVARITKVGNNEYDLGQMREFYETVTETYRSQRQTFGMRWPFEQKRCA
ncbi:hypothetical protein ACFL3V_02820 [Nanoarchaeota archaeon]